MPSELLNTLLTTDDRELLRTELELLKNAVFKLKKNNFAEALKTQVRSQVAEIIEREVRTQTKKPEEYLAEVESQLDQAKVLQLTVSFEPTQQNLEHIATQATTILGEPVILQIEVKPEIVGGAVIVWNGRYHDASLKQKFEATTKQIIMQAF